MYFHSRGNVCPEAWKAGTYLPAVDIASWLDCHNVGVLREDLVEHRAHVLSIAVLVEI